MIAPGLSSRRLTDVLLSILREYNPELHVAIWGIGTFGGGSFALEDAGGQLIGIEALNGAFDNADILELEASGYISVHQRRSNEVAFRPTLNALRFFESLKPALVPADKIGSTADTPTAMHATPPGSLASTRMVLGRQIQQYRVDQRIGGGGMGDVFLAFDTKLHREVAMKVIRKPSSDPAKDRERFLREARAVAALQHPCIVTLYDMGHTEENEPFLIFERLKGEGLDDCLKRGPLGSLRGLFVVKEITRGLAKAHSLGLVHRDLKPGNIFLTEDSVKILDFGLVKMLTPPRGDEETQPQLSNPDELTGTRGFMAPEQVYSKPVTAATDVFNLGLIAHLVLAGEHPFEGKDSAERQASICQSSPATLKEESLGLPNGLAALVARCLDRDPVKRFQTAGEVEAAMAAICVPVLKAAETSVAPADTNQDKTAGSGAEAVLEVGGLREETLETTHGVRRTQLLAIRNNSEATVSGSVALVASEPPIPGLPAGAHLRIHGTDGRLFEALPSKQASLFTEVLAWTQSVERDIPDEWVLPLVGGDFRLPVDEYALTIEVMGGPRPLQTTIFVSRETVLGNPEVAFERRPPFALRHREFVDQFARELAEQAQVAASSTRVNLRPFFDPQDPSCIHRREDGAADRYRIGLKNAGGNAARSVSVAIQSCDLDVAQSAVGRLFPFEHSSALEQNVPVSERVISYVDILQVQAPIDFLVCRPEIALPQGAFSMTLVLLATSGDQSFPLTLQVSRGAVGESVQLSARAARPRASPNDRARAKLDTLARERALAGELEAKGNLIQSRVQGELEILLAEAKEAGMLHGTSSVSKREAPGPTFALQHQERYRRQPAVHSIHYSIWSFDREGNVGGWLQVEIPRQTSDPLLLRHNHEGGTPTVLASIPAEGGGGEDDAIEAARTFWEALMDRVVQLVDAKQRDRLR